METIYEIKKIIREQKNLSIETCLKLLRNIIEGDKKSFGLNTGESLKKFIKTYKSV